MFRLDSERIVGYTEVIRCGMLQPCHDGYTRSHDIPTYRYRSKSVCGGPLYESQTIHPKTVDCMGGSQSPLPLQVKFAAS